MEFPRLHLVAPGSRLSLREINPSKTPGLSGANLQERAAAEGLQAANGRRLADLQYSLYAEATRSLLVVLQGMDASGKDGAIRNVFGAFSPQGTRVVAFTRPTPDEAAHDFLWRVHKKAPGRGDAVVFNRSHYEDVLVPRVRGTISPETCRSRYTHINAFERLLAENGTTILKFFLHISRDEQKERFQARLTEPSKHWKFDEGDLDDRGRWPDYMAAYEEALSECSTPFAPWYVIPADKKWYRDWALSTIVRETLEAMAPVPPAPDFNPRAIKID